jgi:tetratricopeptide (TPR) repeat protein
MLDPTKAGRDSRLEIGQSESNSILESEDILSKLERARELRALQRFDDAESIVDSLLAIAPAHFGAVVEHGHLRRCRGDRDGAAVAFAAAVAINPYQLNIRVELARDVRALGRLDQAEFVLENVLVTEPNLLGALIERGHICRTRGDHIGAARAFAAAFAITPDQAGLTLELVRELRILDRLDEAKAILDALLAKEPQQIGALIEHGHLDRKRGDHAGAAAAFEAAATVNPQHADVKLELARELRALNRFDDAETTLGSLLAIMPSHFVALVERGHLRRKRGDHSGATASFEAAAVVDPTNLGIQVELAHELRALGRLDQADVVLENALATAPSLLGALVERGHVRRSRDDHVGAARAYAAAFAVAPDQAGLTLELVREQRILNRVDEAETILNGLLTINPQQIGALIERGHLYRKCGDHGGAAAAFEAAAAVNPEHADVKLELARELRALNRFDDAETTLGSLLAIMPSHFVALVERGQLRRKRGDHRGAATAFEAAAATNSQRFDIKIELVHELQALNELDEAAVVLESHLKMDPDNAPAMIALGHLNLSGNRLAEAEQLFLRAIELEPTNANSFSALGRLSRGRGDRARAIGYFRSALDADPHNLHLRQQLSEELIDHGETDEALRLIDSVVNADPSNCAAQMQAGHLYRLKGDHQRALQAFGAVPVGHPHFTQALIQTAREKWAIGLRSEAKQTLQSILVQEPAQLTATLLLAEYALAGDETKVGFELAFNAIESHPAQVEPYLVAARAAASRLDENGALDLLERARTRFGFRPEIAATQIHIFRIFRRFTDARSIIRQLDGTLGAQTHVALWMERTSFAISQGEFALAWGALQTPPSIAPQDLARAHFLRAQFFEAQRQYRHAIVSYQDALAHAPEEGAWHDEMSRALLLVGDLENSRKHLQISFQLNAAARRAKGQSLNISQHHTGQLLDEFAMEADVWRAVQEISVLAPIHRIEPLKQLERQHPDNTAPALMLALALRQAGHFKTTPTGRATDLAGGGDIPKHIVQYWHAATPPADVHQLISSWQVRHPDYQHSLFNDATATAFLRAHHPPKVALAFRRASHPAQRADIFRLGYLAIKGGFYVDADDRCLDRLDAYVPVAAKFIGYQENYATIANNFLGVVPRHPVMLLALNLAVEALNRGDHDIVWLSTGPGLMTRAFCQVLAEPGNAMMLAEAAILELHIAQRLLGIHSPACYKQTTEHWSNAAFRSDFPKGRHTGVIVEVK